MLNALMIRKSVVFSCRLKESTLSAGSHRLSDSEFQVTEAMSDSRKCRAIMLNGEQMAPGRAEMTMSGEVGDRCTAIHQVLWNLAMNISIDHGRDLVTDMIRNVQPVELSMHEMCQATDELLSTADDTSSRVQHLLKSVR